MTAETTTKVWVPGDVSALSLGADDVVMAIMEQAEQQGQSVEIIRNGSRGMIWLEPLLEVQLDDGRRVAYGPVEKEDVASLFATGIIQKAAI